MHGSFFIGERLFGADSFPSLALLFQFRCLLNATNWIRRANKIRRIVDAARPGVARRLRIGADWTRARHNAARHSGRDYFVRGNPVLDPLLKRGDRVPGVRAPGGTATAMPDVREKEKPQELV
jgi:hypothetical protein